jgi:hypothetical protein
MLRVGLEQQAPRNNLRGGPFLVTGRTILVTLADNFGHPICGTEVNQHLTRPSFGCDVRADCLLQFLSVDLSLSAFIGTQVVLPMSEVYRRKLSDRG